VSGIDGKCLAPKDKRPGITTSFCVYDEAHDGNHSWEDTPEKRKERLFAPVPVSGGETTEMSSAVNASHLPRLPEQEGR
jgi:hypothetical protein